MNTLKTMTAAAGIAVIGSIASAATVAEISSEGTFVVGELGAFADGILVSGNFLAAIDTAFDTSAVNDFVFDLDFTATGLPAPIDEQLLVHNIISLDFNLYTSGIITYRCCHQCIFPCWNATNGVKSIYIGCSAIGCSFKVNIGK